MQLDKLVTFYKALGDPTRIRILAMLANGPLHGQALAGKLGVTPPTITHHMIKLREAGLVYERREKNTIYFYLHEVNVKRNSQAIVEMIGKAKERPDDIVGPEKEREAMNVGTEKAQVIKNFFTVDGRLKRIPTQRKKKLIVFEHLVEGLQVGRKYTEKEINEYIKQFHEDYATIRREFIMNHYMYRENGIYERNPRELWAKPEEMK
jgi:hypothetical protein